MAEAMEVFLRLCAFAGLPGGPYPDPEPALPTAWSVPDYIPSHIVNEVW